MAILLLLGIVACPGADAPTRQLPAIAVPRTDAPPAIDGTLLSPCWRSAAVIQGLAPALGGGCQAEIDRRPTVIRLLWDPRALYVAFACRTDDIWSSGTLKHDEDLYREDVCEVFIDGAADQRQWIEIQVSPANQTLDLMSMLTAEPTATATLRLTGGIADRDLWSDRHWDAEGLRTATGRLVEHGAVVGWTMEMAIPCRNFVRRLGLAQLSPMTMRANFARYDHPSHPDGTRGFLPMYWSAVENGCPHISPAAMGSLTLVEDRHAP